MKKRMAAVLAVLCLCLTACGGKEEGGTEGVCDLETASGLEGTAVLLTVDGREVPAWRYLYWLAWTCDQMAEQYAESGLPLDWDAAVEGGSLADYVKEQALADTALYATVENWAERYGCEPAETASGTEPLPDLGVGESRMGELEQVRQLYAGLYQLSSTEGSDLAPAAEALEEYGKEAGAVTLDRILVTAGEDQEAARERASELFSQLNGAEDQAATFSRLAAENDDPAGPRTVVPGDGSLADSLLEAAQALEEGQCSGILESEEGFSILRRLPLDAAPLAEAYFNASLEEAARTAAVTVAPAYSQLDAAAFYNAWKQIRLASEAD